jgi:hypothetical protein
VIKKTKVTYIENDLESYTILAKCFSNKENIKIEERMDWKDLKDTNLLKNRKELIEVINRYSPVNKNQITYLLIIKTEVNTLNITNLQYLISLMDIYSNIIAYLWSDNQNDTYQESSQFLGFAIHQSDIRNRIFSSFVKKKSEKNEYARLSFKRLKDVHWKLSPLFKLNMECLNNANDLNIIPWNIKMRSYRKKDYFLKSWFNSQCVRVLLEINEPYLENNDFKKLTDHMSVLAYYLFLLTYANRVRLGKKIESIDKNKIIQNICFCIEIAEGFLQLMENAVLHSQYHQGYVCFRIHTLNNIRDEKYLNMKFPNFDEYMKKENKLFLEMQLLDVSENIDIPNRFVSNINKKINKGNEKLKVIQKEFPKFINAKSTLNLQSFFMMKENEKKFWEAYNNIDNNIAHHFGLKIFSSIIEAQTAIFKAVSSKNYNLRVGEDGCYYNYLEKLSDESKNNLIEDELFHIPGSEYSVLISLDVIENEIIQKIADVNANINYVNKLYNKYNICELGKEIKFKEGDIFGSIRNVNAIDSKEKVINEFSQKLSNIIIQKINKDNNLVFLYDSHSIDTTCIEYFCKAFFIALYNNQNLKINMMIVDCSLGMMLEIIRNFLIFFDKAGDSASNVFSNLQLYLRGETRGDEFLLAGSSKSQIMAHTQKLSFARSIDMRIQYYMSILFQEDNRLESTNTNANNNLDLIPFDLLEIPSQKSIFEKDVEATIQAPIREKEFGCHHVETHVRVGSKIHLTDFYEAELLFHNKYYISRFAYLISKQIMASSKTDSNSEKQLVLVGYEAYSEALIGEIVDILKQQYKKSSEYIIYEQKKDYFMYLNDNDDVMNKQYILIVPINSTLTTHNKLKDKLQEKLKPKKEGTDKELDIIANYAIILICDFVKNTEKGLIEEFWEGIDENKKCIETKKEIQIKPNVEYFINIPAVWQPSVKCEMCMPKNLLEEMPLIETNRESIVPMQKISLKAEEKKFETFKIKYEKGEINNRKRIEKLSTCTYYQHSEYKENHFVFYFKCEDYYLKEKSDVKDWLENTISKQLDSKHITEVIYDIVIAPINSNNTGFVEAFNEKVFKQPALVLKIDVDKEYRKNVATKYHHLAILYENIKKSDKKAEIRFHYVDSIIASGRTLLRMQSIIKSIFNTKFIGDKSKDGKLSVFYSITILINRISKFTQNNYIQNEGNFNYYVNINISPMRNHEDACTICKLLSEYEKLYKFSATNRTSAKWKKLQVKHECKDVINFYSDKDFCNKRNMGLRLITTHVATYRLSQLSGDIDTIQVQIVKLMLDSTIKNSNNVMYISDDILENIISYIKVISRPFIVFDEHVKQAIFKIMLYLLHYLISKEKEEILKLINSQNVELYSKLFFTLDKHVTTPQNKYDIVLTLINRLAAMGSNYLIRKEIFLKIMDYSSENFNDIKASDNEVYLNKSFENNYIFAIKRMVTISSDDTRALRLEEMLSNSLDDSNFIEVINTLFKENILILKTAIEDLSDKCPNILNNDSKQKKLKEAVKSIENELNMYYYKSFREVFRINNMEIDHTKIVYLVAFYQEIKKHIGSKEPKIKVYEILSKLFCSVTGASHANFYLDDLALGNEYESNNDNNPIIFKCDFGDFKICRSDEYKSDTIILFYERFITMFRHELISGIERDYNSILPDYMKEQEKSRLLSSVKATEHDKLSNDISDLFLKTKDELYENPIMSSYIFQVSNLRLTTYYRMIIAGLKTTFHYTNEDKEEEIQLLLKYKKYGLNYLGQKIRIEFKDQSSPETVYYFRRFRLEYDAELFIALLMYNAAKHTVGATENKDIVVKCYFDNNRIVISNKCNQNFKEVQELTVKIKENQKKEIYLNRDADFGITLWVLNKICEEYDLGSLEFFATEENNEAYFNVSMPILLPIN